MVLNVGTRMTIKVISSILMYLIIGVKLNANHPFHMHGYSFRVVAMDKLGENTSIEFVRRLDEEGFIRRNLVDAPYKDTVTVPDGGYTMLRFLTNNPGMICYVIVLLLFLITNLYSQVKKE